MHATQYDEPGRLRALWRLDVLDTAPEASFDALIALLQKVLYTPIVAVSLVDEERQWFKASLGLECSQTPRSASFCSVTITSDKPLIVPDAAADPRFKNNPLVVAAPGIRSYLGIPLRMSNGYQVGALCVIDQKPRNFTTREVAILQDAAKLVVMLLEQRQAANKDHLTQALTGKVFADCLDREIGRFIRHAHATCVVAFDIDDFKLINQRYGRAVGDEVLIAVASAVSGRLRQADCIARLGGEEFAVLLPDTNLKWAIVAAERYREAVRSLRIDVGSKEPLEVSASFGVVEITGSDCTPVKLLERADEALSIAKRNGDCCEIAA